jgi:TonB family protein
MAAIARSNVAFKRAVIFSLTAHFLVFILLTLSPRLPKPKSKGMIHYVNVISFPGGGGTPGGGRGEEKISETPLPQRETLKDLTTSQKIQQEPPNSFRHPVEKPEKETKPKTDKKVSIQKSQPVMKKAQTDSDASESSEKAAGKGTGTGSGVRIGAGDSGSGSGGGSESAFSSQIGLSNFPFTYYLQFIIDKVSGNWFTSLVDPGITGNFQATVHFKIHKNGQVSDLKIEETSGIRSLDMSALRAIQTSAPFPPLPRTYDEEYLGIYLIFEHSK